MYGQGNNAQFGQGSQYPKPHFQQRLIAPPHPFFQHGPPALQYSIIQQGLPSIPPHFTHASLPQVQQGPLVQIPTTEMLSICQSFLPPPPPQQVRVSTSMASPYPSVQQNFQWTHNTHHPLPPAPLPLEPPSSSPIRQEMFQPSLPPLAIATLPSRAQAPYKSPVYPPQPGGMQVSQQVLLPPPPPLPISNFFSPAPFGSFVYSSNQDSNVPAAGPMPPPPPPSSPPPRPPSPPPLTSPIHTFGTVASALPRTAPDLSHNSESGPMADHSDLDMMHSDSKVVVSSQIRDEAPAIDDYEIHEGTENCEVGSPMEDDLPSVECLKPDLLPPPPKPSEEKVVQKIEILCHFIANNGPDFEHMARHKESGNPEFKFLFGGKPGSEAAVAHEYFEWMKEKCKSACKLQDKHNSSAWRPPGINTLTQTSYLTDAGVSHSPPDSDMYMEDDITQPDEEQQVYTSFEGLSHEPVLIPKDLYIKEQVCASVKSNGDSLGWHDVSSSSGLAGQEEGSKILSDHNHLIYEWLLPKVDSPLTNSPGAAKCPSKSNEEESFVSSLEDLSQQNKSAAAVGIGSGKPPCQLIKGASPLPPFRLLPDYASDDSLEGDDKPCLEDSSPLKASPSTAAAVTSVQGVIGSNLQAGSNVAYATAESILACSQSMPSNALEFSPASQRTREINITSFATVIAEELCGNYAERSIDNGSSLEVLQQKIVLDGVHDSISEKGKSQLRKEDAKSGSTFQKIDEFGRIVREGSSESDSEVSLYHGSRRKRRRSWSRGPSPNGRRNPWRRREKRSWSRSLSPKKRSKSRSPTYKHSGGYDGEKMRRNKGQLPMCFDFLQGRCHRGQTCRYIHHDSGRSDGSRRNRSNQQYIEIPHVSRASGFQESKKAFSERPVHEEDVLGDGEKELVSLQDAVPSIIHGKDDKSVLVKLAKSEMSGELAVTMHGMSDIKEEKSESTTSLHDITNHLKQVATSQGIASSVENLVIPISQAKQVETSHGSSTSHSSQIQPSTLFQHRLLSSEASPVQSYSRTSCVGPSVSAESLPPTYFIIPAVIPAVNIPDYHLQLSVSLPSLSLGLSTPSPAPHLPREDDLMQPASEFPPFQGPSQNLYSYSAVPPNSSWSLPPPPPPPLPPPPPFVNNSTLNGMRNHFSQLPVQGINSSSLYGKGSISSQPISLRMQSFPGNNCSSGGFSPQSSQNHPYSQQQRPLHGLLRSPTDSLTLNRAGYWNINHIMSIFASDLDKNQPSHLSDSGGSRISNYYNPYASTFDQPLSSKFSSNVKQEKDVLHSNQHGVGSIGSEFLTFSLKPETADLLRLHSDQYDPLFDSIDPLSNSCMKSDHGLKHEPIDDSISLRLKDSDKPLDVEESKQKDRVLAEAASIKSENGEYSETEDAEVGDVENESGSNALDATNTSPGELEINQVKMPGKRKKSEDSRSMKLFKVSLADFVKEVLKPSWRQGNMSKEAFKTIVKKTVDKVSGAIKSHQIPKSQAKISQYIDSSQRKLTKLVMGYVQKYVKV